MQLNCSFSVTRLFEMLIELEVDDLFTIAFVNIICSTFSAVSVGPSLLIFCIVQTNYHRTF